MKDRICFIIPYFGKFNNYFDLFLKTCESNKDICDWLIFTDDKTEYDYPANIRVIHMDWEQMVEYFQNRFDFEISLKRPYKLCDFKPSYGYVFEEYLVDYKYWGHCDVDLLWGKISHFLTDEILSEYEKIFDLGHCTVYRNSYDNNRRFFLNLDGKMRHLEVYTNKNNVSFDEEYKQSINNIYNNFGIAVYESSVAANLYTKSSVFRLTQLSDDKIHYDVERKKKGLFVWDRGCIYRYIKENSELYKKEYMYIHFQSRPMKNKVPDLKADEFKIIPNVFEVLEISTNSISMSNYDDIKKKYFNLHYLKLRIRNLMIKIKKLVENEGR